MEISSVNFIHLLDLYPGAIVEKMQWQESNSRPYDSDKAVSALTNRGTHATVVVNYSASLLIAYSEFSLFLYLVVVVRYSYNNNSNK
jgi:hypothetical protein